MPRKVLLPLSCIVLLMAVGLACNLPIAAGQPAATQAPQATPLAAGSSSASVASAATQTSTPSSSATQTPAGIPFSYQGVSFTIPDGLASGANGTQMPKVDDQGGAPWEVAPAYIKIVLQNYPAGKSNSFEPQILVYPADEYAQTATYGDYPAQAIQAVATINANPAAALPTQLPFLPTFNAGQAFDAQTGVLKFQNGGGLRYLTEFAQDVEPVTNSNMIYTFQGLTADGKYYVIAIFPAGAPFLDPGGESTPAVPDGGIPFDYNSGNQADYYSAVTDRLNLTAPEVFTPSLDTLDALVQSISVTAP